jgi:hypothetical protein
MIVRTPPRNTGAHPISEKFSIPEDTQAQSAQAFPTCCRNAAASFASNSKVFDRAGQSTDPEESSVRTVCGPHSCAHPPYSPATNGRYGEGKKLRRRKCQ